MLTATPTSGIGVLTATPTSGIGCVDCYGMSSPGRVSLGNDHCRASTKRRRRKTRCATSKRNGASSIHFTKPTIKRNSNKSKIVMKRIKFTIVLSSGRCSNRKNIHPLPINERCTSNAPRPTYCSIEMMRDQAKRAAEVVARCRLITKR